MSSKHFTPKGTKEAKSMPYEREEMGRGASTVLLTNHTYLLN